MFYFASVILAGKHTLLPQKTFFVDGDKSLINQPIARFLVKI